MTTITAAQLKDIQDQFSEIRKDVSDILSRLAVIDGKMNILDSHDKILVRGNGVPSLQEIVRGMNSNIEEFMASERRQKEDRISELRKWKWLIFGTIVPGFIVLVGQALIFYIRVLPMLPILK